MATVAALAYKTDGVIELTNLHYTDDSGADVSIDDGVGTVDIVEKLTGTAIPDGSGIPLVFISAGKYRASVPWSLDLVKRGKYTAQVAIHGIVSDLHYYGEKDFTIVVDS